MAVNGHELGRGRNRRSVQRLSTALMFAPLVHVIQTLVVLDAAVKLAAVLVLLEGGVEGREEAESQNDREPDPPQWTPRLGWLAGV